MSSRAGSREREHAVESQQRRHDACHADVDVVPRHLATFDRVGEVRRAHHPVRHLDVESGLDRLGRVADAEDPVADDEPLETPLVAEDLGEQAAMITAVHAVHLVVGAHHTGDALVDDPLELREVHLVERDLVDLDVDLEPGVLHRVDREVLHGGHHVALQAPGERGSHLADVVGVLAVRLLRPAPRRVPQDVDAHRPREVGARRTQLASDRVADTFLEIGIPRGTASHRHREAGRVADHDATGPVGERDARQSDAFDTRRVEGSLVVAAALEELQTGPRRGVAVEAPQLLLRGHRGDDVAALPPLAGRPPRPRREPRRTRSDRSRRAWRRS